jgi:hypothetical protein
MASSMATRTTSPPCRDVLEVLPGLAERALIAVRLHPRRGEEPARDATKMGGSFLWPADEPWPRCPQHQLPYVGVFQLRAADFPEMEFFPGTDLFQLLWCPQDHEVIIEPRVFWRAAGTILQPLADIPQPHLPTEQEREEANRSHELEVRLGWLRMALTQPSYIEQMLRHPSGRMVLQRATRLEALPEDFPALQALAREELQRLEPLLRRPAFAEQHYLPRPCRLFPERVTEYPHVEELTEEEKQKLRAWDVMSVPGLRDRREDHTDSGLVLYERELSVCDGTKVGGYVPWIQGREVPVCRCGHEMSHLLTVASAECDGANWRRWLPAEEQHLWDGRHMTTEPFVSAPGLMLGDVGKVYFFICRRCPDWPVRHGFQCS